MGQSNLTMAHQILDTVEKLGDAFDLFDAGAVTGSFDAVNLPALDGGLTWDASDLPSTGQVRGVPEPGIGALLASALLVAATRALHLRARHGIQ